MGASRRITLSHGSVRCILDGVGRFRFMLVQLATVLALVVGAPAAAQSPGVSPDLIDEVSVVVLQLRDPQGGTLTPDQLDAALTVIEARLASLPAPGATLTAIPGDRIRIDLADPSQIDTVTRLAAAPGVFRIVGIPSDRAHEVEVGRGLPEDMEVSEVVATGHVIQASVGQDALGLPAVDLQLDTQGADAFDAWAADNFGGMAALLLDDIVVSAATLQATEFDGRIQISGSFEPTHVQELAAILTGGALPVLAEPLPDCLPATCPIPSVRPRASAAP
jgi:preprotein translocase subunit SecD